MPRKNFADVDIVMAGLCWKLGVRLLHVIRNYGLERCDGEKFAGGEVRVFDNVIIGNLFRTFRRGR